MATRKTDRSSPSGPAANRKGQVTFDAANCPAAAVTVQSVPIPEVKVGDIVLLSPVATIADIAIGVGYCLVAGTASVPFCNPTAGAINPASQAYNYTLLKL